MTELIVYGSGDDNIEVEGDFKEEFYDIHGDGYLLFGDGTVLRVIYGDGGAWAIDPVITGGDTYIEKIYVGDADADEVDGRPGYSDHVKLNGPTLSWAGYSKSLARLK